MQVIVKLQSPMILDSQLLLGSALLLDDSHVYLLLINSNVCTNSFVLECVNLAYILYSINP